MRHRHRSALRHMLYELRSGFLLPGTNMLVTQRSEEGSSG